MRKKILFIILGAFLVLALIFLLWFWFFGRHNKSDVLPNNGSLGTSADAGNTAANGGTNGNGQAPYGSNAGSNTNGGGSGSGGGSQGGTSVTPPVYTYIAGSSSIAYYGTPSGVTWFGAGGSGGGFSFSTTPINDVSGGKVSGTPYIPTVTGADGQQVSIFSSLLTVIGGCLAQYGVEQLAVKPAIVATDQVTNVVGNLFGSFLNFLLPGTGLGDTTKNQNVTDSGTHVNTATDTITQCLTRTLGRIAVQQITQSTVNWINSGFNGQPAYVQDYGQFFSNVADQSAGAFIQGSGLAFLCSPFQLQVKIAIAQAYANRRSGGASSSCTLTGVTGNINNFLKGNFSDGGWPAFLQFTTVPANNPYAGYISGQIALNNQVIYDTNNAKSNISPGGFLSQTQEYDCKTTKDTDGTVHKYDCKTRVVTPGSTIESTLESTLGQNVSQLGLGDSIDQILGALANAITTKVLYNGLANAGQVGQGVSQNPATSQAQTLMNSIQAGVTSAQQYASIEQGAISDIQNSQRSVANVADCWSKLASSTAAAPDKVAQGSAGFNNAVSTLTQLQTQVVAYNSKISAANSSIASLQSLQTDLLLATVATDVSSVQSRFNSLKAAGTPHFYTSTDITTAQQDRSSTQSGLAGINQNTSTQLSQCYAL